MLKKWQPGGAALKVMFESPHLGLGNGNSDALVGNMGPQTATLSPPLVRTGLVVVEIMTFSTPT